MIFFSAYLEQRLLYVKTMLRAEALHMTKVVDLVFEAFSAAKKFSVNIDMLGAMTSVGIISLYEFVISKAQSC